MNRTYNSSAVEIAGPPTRGVSPSRSLYGVASLGHEGSNNIIGVTIMLLVLCLAAVGGRFKARQMTKAHIGIDDYLALVALVFLIALSVQEFFLAHGLAIAVRTFPPDRALMDTLAKIEVVSQITYVFVLTIARTSILFLYRRLFSLTQRWFRVAWYCDTFLALGYGLALFTSLGFECSPKPVSVLWKSPSECRTRFTVPVTIGFLNALIDLLILVLPIRVVWTLHFDAKKRLAVCAIFGLGLAGVSVSLGRAAAFIHPDITSPSSSVKFAIWSTTEAAVTLLCACLPLLRPVFAAVYKALSTFRSDTIRTFGLEGSNPKSSPKTSSEQRTSEEDEQIFTWPTKPETVKKKSLRLSLQLLGGNFEQNITHEIERGCARERQMKSAM